MESRDYLVFIDSQDKTTVIYLGEEITERTFDQISEKFASVHTVARECPRPGEQLSDLEIMMSVLDWFEIPFSVAEPWQIQVLD